MLDVPFVDAHVHLWDLDHIAYPWLTPPFSDSGPAGSVAAIASTYLPADYRAESAAWRVAGYVHIDAGAHPSAALDETVWLGGLDDGPTAIVAFVALDDADVAEHLAAQAAQGRVRGIRHIVNWHSDPRRSYTPRDVTRDPAWQRGFAALADHGLSFDLQCYPAQMPALARLFERHPEIPVIIDHLGMPVVADPDGQADWREGMRALARLDHVHLKISGAGFIDPAWRVARIRPWIREAIDLFGAHRCCVASDFPTDRLFAGFDATLELYASLLADFSPHEQRAIWGANADRFYRLGLGLEAA